MAGSNSAAFVLKRELRSFSTSGLKALRKDLRAGREQRSPLPARRTWSSCPLSYRLGRKGSVDRDSLDHYVNAFTLAWDGQGQDYFDELEVLILVESELKHRDSAQKFRRKGAA